MEDSKKVDLSEATLFATQNKTLTGAFNNAREILEREIPKGSRMLITMALAQINNTLAKYYDIYEKQVDSE